MLRWFKARERGEAGASEVADGARASNDARRASKGKFLLEPLEPRVLLSADSIFGEVYRTLLEDEGQNTGAEFAVIVEEIDAATSAEIAAADGADCGIAATDSGPTVDWPEGWQVGALQDPTENPIRDLTHESEAAETTVATEDEEQPEASVLEQAGAASADPELPLGEDDSQAVVASGDDPLSGTVTDSELPRGPPVASQISSALLSADSLVNNDLSPSDSPQGDEGRLVDAENALFADTFDDVQARAPPDSQALTDETLAPILEQAVRLWTDSGFRIVQEALRNIEKHAQATEVAARIEFGAGRTEVSVSDNGKGFVVGDDLTELPRAGKLGLAGMAERVRLLAGSMKIESRPGKGTRVMITVPI